MYGMHRRLRLAIAVAAMCFPTLAARAATVHVTVQNDSFGNNNAPVTINVGDTVDWTLSAGFHTVTSGMPDSPDGRFDAPVDSSHTSFTFTFTQAGTYPYYCKFHALCCGMSSSIIVKAAVTTIPKRSLGGTSDNAVAVGRDGAGNVIAAVAAGTKLYLVKPLDANLADAANWTGGKDLGAGVSGRPAFGVMGGALVIAVGTDDGRGHIFNVATGADAGSFDVSNGAISNAPAILDHAGNADIYWAAQSSNGPVIVRSRGTGVGEPVSLGTSGSVLSSPAIFQGVLIVGTSANVQTYRVDPTTGALTPQSSAGGGSTFNTSPVVGGNGEALIGTASGAVHKINLSTGAEDGAALILPSGAGPLSDPFYDGSSGLAAFGGSNGNVYFVAGNAIGALATLSSTANFGTAAVRSPVTVSGRTYVADASGKFGQLGGANPVELGAAAGKAVAATGSVASTDVAVVNTTDGTIAAIPLLSGGRTATKTVAQHPAP